MNANHRIVGYLFPLAMYPTRFCCCPAFILVSMTTQAGKVDSDKSAGEGFGFSFNFFFEKHIRVTSRIDAEDMRANITLESIARDCGFGGLGHMTINTYHTDLLHSATEIFLCLTGVASFATGADTETGGLVWCVATDATQPGMAGRQYFIILLMVADKAFLGRDGVGGAA